MSVTLKKTTVSALLSAVGQLMEMETTNGRLESADELAELIRNTRAEIKIGPPTPKPTPLQQTAIHEAIQLLLEHGQAQLPQWRRKAEMAIRKYRWRPTKK